MQMIMAVTETWQDKTSEQELCLSLFAQLHHLDRRGSASKYVQSAGYKVACLPSWNVAVIVAASQV